MGRWLDILHLSLETHSPPFPFRPCPLGVRARLALGIRMQGKESEFGPLHFCVLWLMSHSELSALGNQAQITALPHNPLGCKILSLPPRCCPVPNGFPVPCPDFYVWSFIKQFSDDPMWVHHLPLTGSLSDLGRQSAATSWSREEGMEGLEVTGLATKDTGEHRSI